MLQGVIQRVIDDTLSVAVDSVFRPPEKHNKNLVREEAGATLTGEAAVQGFCKVYPEG